MAEEKNEASQPRTTRGRLANLSSMVDRDCMELVWENGQVFQRRLSERAQMSPSCIGFSSSQLENRDQKISTKRARFGSLVSGFNKSPIQTDSKLENHDKVESYLKYTHINHLKYIDNPASLFPEFDHTNFDVFLQHNRTKSSDKQYFKDSQIVPVHDSKPESEFRFVEEASVPIFRSREVSSETPDSMDGLPHSKKLQVHEPGTDMKRETAKVLRFFRPTPLLKANIQRTRETWPTSGTGLLRAENLQSNDKIRSAQGCSCNNVVESKLIDQANCLKGVKEQLVPRIAKPPVEPVPDEQSQAIGHKDPFTNIRLPDQVHGQILRLDANLVERRPEAVKSMEPPFASTSVCSLGASNDVTYTLKRRYEDTDQRSADPSEELHEESRVRRRTRAKRKGTPQDQNLSERRQRGKINKKMRALQKLIPNCNKADKASMLDEAIVYLKSLQLQLQMMSIGSRLCVPPLMLPSWMQKIQLEQQPHLSSMGGGLMGCNTAQFLSLPMPGVTNVPGITESRVPMVGFLDQAPLAAVSPFSGPPFMPNFHAAGPSISVQPGLIPAVSGASLPVGFLPSVYCPLSSSNVAGHNNVNKQANN